MSSFDTSAQEAGLRYSYQPRQRDGWIDHHELIGELVAWCQIFAEEGLAPEEGGASAGNLSFRTPRGLVITPSRSRLKSGLGRSDLLEVVRVELLPADSFRIHYLGGDKAPAEGGLVPSSDVLMHHRIYDARPDVTAVFHGHDPAMLAAADRLGVPITPQAQAFGTIADALATVEGLGQERALIRRDHGFVTVGRTLRQAGELALDLHRRAMER